MPASSTSEISTDRSCHGGDRPDATLRVLVLGVLEYAALAPMAWAAAVTFAYATRYWLTIPPSSPALRRLRRLPGASTAEQQMAGRTGPSAAGVATGETPGW